MMTVSLVVDRPSRKHSILCALEKIKIECLGAFHRPADALREIPSRTPSVILLHVRSMHRLSLECASKLRRLLPAVPIVVLSGSEKSDDIFAALKAGASGYLLGDELTATGLKRAIREAKRGGSPMSPRVARVVVSQFHRAEFAPDLEGLSAREREVLECLARGWRYKEIGSRLNITIDTVRKHLHRIYRKLKVSSRTEAVVKYLGK